MAATYSIDLEGINENINSNIVEYEKKSLTSLIINKPYVVRHMQVLNTRFGQCILAILQDNVENITFKTFLPSRFIKTLSADVINKINCSEGKYGLVYLGQSNPPSSGIKPRSLIRFDVVH